MTNNDDIKQFFKKFYNDDTKKRFLNDDAKSLKRFPNDNTKKVLKDSLKMVPKKF